MNACEKLGTHPKKKIWTIFKNKKQGKKKKKKKKKNPGPQRKKKQKFAMSCVHSALSIIWMMINKEIDGICKEWKG